MKSNLWFPDTKETSRRRADDVWRTLVVPGFVLCFWIITLISVAVVFLQHQDWFQGFGANLTVNDLAWLSMAVVAILAAVLIDAYRKKLNSGPQQKNPSSERSRRILLAACFFYILLFVIAKWFTAWTDYSLQSDWTLLLIASIPVLAYILVAVIENASWLKFKFGDLEIGYERLIPLSTDQSLRVDPTQDAIRKSDLTELRRMADEIAKEKRKPKVLLVPIADEEFRVNFIALRQYIYELEKVTPMEYIVFVDSLDTYLGFMPVKSFTSRYPKTPLEIFLESQEEIGEEGIRGYVGIDRLTDTDPERIREARERLVLRQWDQNMENPFIRGMRDIARLGANRLRIEQSQGLLDAYQLMVENDLNGIPLTNARQEYVGILTKDKITEQAITKLLDISRRAEKK